MKKLYVVGHLLKTCQEGVMWNLVGVYSSKALAIKNCKRNNDFYGELELDNTADNEIVWEVYLPPKVKQVVSLSERQKRILEKMRLFKEMSLKDVRNSFNLNHLDDSWASKDCKKLLEKGFIIKSADSKPSNVIYKIKE